jgi:hypothetical protein
MIHAPESLDTPRIHLRKPTVSDASAILETYAHDAEVTRYLFFRLDQTLDEIRNFLQRTLDAWENASAFGWVLVLKENDMLVGMVEVRINQCRAELGYVLARPFWNKGLMSKPCRRPSNGHLRNLSCSGSGRFVMSRTGPPAVCSRRRGCRVKAYCEGGAFFLT